MPFPENKNFVLELISKNPALEIINFVVASNFHVLLR